MKFQEMKTHVCNRKGRAKRPHWKRGSYVEIGLAESGTSSMVGTLPIVVLIEPNGDPAPYQPTRDDLTATDWATAS
jgi:hypothetical protein